MSSGIVGDRPPGTVIQGAAGGGDTNGGPTNDKEFQDAVTSAMLDVGFDQVNFMLEAPGPEDDD